MNIILLILNLFGLGGVAVFLHYLVKGLRERIQTLTETVESQKETLTAVRERADEFSRLNQGYKQALDDFEDMGKKYDERRNQLLAELEQANAEQQTELIALKEKQLEELDLKQKSFDRIPELEANLEKLIEDLGRQVKILKPESHGSHAVNEYIRRRIFPPPASFSAAVTSSIVSSALEKWRTQQIIEAEPQFESKENPPARDDGDSEKQEP